jgi:hypothetical protein
MIKSLHFAALMTLHSLFFYLLQALARKQHQPAGFAVIQNHVNYLLRGL